jgi:hypothetical protein
MADLVTTEVLIGFVHVAYDNGDMLKGVIVAAPAGGNRPAFRSEILDQLDYLLAEPHAHDAHPYSE